MNIRTILIFSTLLIAPIAARPKTDVLVMRNGDRLTCEIKKLDKGVLFVGLDYVDGTISVQWSQVARLESNQLFLVQTAGGSQYQGTLRTAESAAGQPVKIEIEDGPQQRDVLDRKDVVEVGQTSASFWRRFSGSIDSGMIYTKGNDTTQYNLGSQVTFRKERWTAEANFSSAFSSSSGATSTSRNQLNLQGLRLVRKQNWFYSTLASFLQSSEQSINLQTSLGGGVGRYLKNTNRARISMTGGFVWQGTQYQPSGEGVVSQNAVAAFIAGNIQAFRFKKTALSLTANLLPVLSQAGRVRFNTNASYSIQVINNLWWKFSFYGNWDNHPPLNLSGTDYGMSSGLSYSFN
jgi:hypothetical protein